MLPHGVGYDCVRSIVSAVYVFPDRYMRVINVWKPFLIEVYVCAGISRLLRPIREQ